MASIAMLLFAVGTVILAVAFAAHVGHAVLLANGRRVLGALAPSLATRQQPAWAGIATGSFIESRSAAISAGPATFATPSALARPALGLSVAAFVALAASMLLRAAIVGRGPWGNLFEFSVAFAVSILGGYLVLSRRYPIRSIGFIPTGVA